MIESEHTCNRNVPLRIVKSTPSDCFCTLVTEFNGIHCAAASRAVANSNVRRIAIHHAAQPSFRIV
jgi:hypothetical protein